MAKKLKKPVVAIGLYGFTVLSVACYLICRFSTPFADWFCSYPAGWMRWGLAKLTGWLPFSLAELLLLLLPLLLIGFVFRVIRLFRRAEDARLKRLFVNAFAGIGLLLSLFVWTCGSGYCTTTLDQKMSLADRPVSAAELRETAELLTAQVNALAPAVQFREDGFSELPCDWKALGRLLCEAYDNMAEETGLLWSYRSTPKPVLLSEGMSKLHLLGMYTYYTGESNVNTKFPPYTKPYTFAHEMAHQRGYAREEEANFIAYLVCMASENDYLRYSGSLNLLEYVYGALYAADKKGYQAVIAGLNEQTREELRAYARFYAAYENSKAGAISEKVNDVYLKTQGQSAGVQSYGLVVDLAVAYLQQKDQ